MSSIEIQRINRLFDGFRKTPFLWEGLLEDLKMYIPSDESISSLPKSDFIEKSRLGKLVEQFVLFELEQKKYTQLLKSNIQIFRGQVTIGELDCLINEQKENIHLEIVYKFYLYDTSFSEELDRWIGPNRNDSLVQKLDKLKGNQMPLLYQPETSVVLDDLNIKATDFIQRLYFKAQLFVPFESESVFPIINNDCINGFYIQPKDLALFKNHTYYVPSKLDWLVEPHGDVEWVSVEEFENTISEFLSSKKSPLCWMRSPEGVIQKFFVVWWE